MKIFISYGMLIFVFLSGCATGGRYADEEEYGASRVKKEGYNFSLIQTISVLDFIDYKDEPNSGKFVAEAFMKKLIKKDYNVVESTELQTVIQAKGLSKPEDLDIDLFREISELIKIDVLLTGTVTEYVFQLADEPEYPSDGKRKKKSPLSRNIAIVGINARFIDIKSGNVVWMDSARSMRDNIPDALNDVVDEIIITFLNDLY